MRVPGAGGMRAAAATFWRETESCLAACLAAWLLGWRRVTFRRPCPAPGPSHRLQCSFWRGAAASTIFLAGWLTIKCWKADNYESNATGDSAIFEWSKSKLLPKRIGGPPIMSRF